MSYTIVDLVGIYIIIRSFHSIRCTQLIKNKNTYVDAYLVIICFLHVLFSCNINSYVYIYIMYIVYIYICFHVERLMFS